jgi:hypothetical protein
MAVAGEAVSNRTLVVQQEWLNTDTQKWSFEPIEDGYYKIKLKHSNKYLDVSAYSMEDFASIWLHSEANVDNQKWLLERLENNTYKIKAKHSGKYLDVRYQSKENSTYIIQHNWMGTDNQKWIIEKVGQETVNSNIENAYSAWEVKLRTYNAENAHLTDLNKTLEDATSKDGEELKKDLESVKAQLQTVQTQIAH